MHVFEKNNTNSLYSVDQTTPKNILSVKFGGNALGLKTYCLYYVSRPLYIWDNLLCAGMKDFWLPCPDFKRCLKNKPKGMSIPCPPLEN